MNQNNTISISITIHVARKSRTKGLSARKALLEQRYSNSVMRTALCYYSVMLTALLEVFVGRRCVEIIITDSKISGSKTYFSDIMGVHR